MPWWWWPVGSGVSALIAAEVNMGVRSLPNWLPYAVLFTVAAGVLLWLGRWEVRVTAENGAVELWAGTAHLPATVIARSAEVRHRFVFLADFAYSMWLAGGGLKGGQVVGQTDDFCLNIVEDPVHIHDLQATLLHCLGFDHTKLTYKHMGREFRLTDVAGDPLKKLLA